MSEHEAVTGGPQPAPASAPTATPEAKPDAKPDAPAAIAGEIEKLKAADLALRESLVTLREKEILALREKVMAFDQHLGELRDKGIFPRRVRLPVTFNNAGWILAVKSFFDPQFEDQALDYLQRAEQLYAAQGYNDVVRPIWTMMLIHLARDNVGRARELAARFRDSVAARKVGDAPDWRSSVDLPWFKALERRRPTVRQELEMLLPRT